MKTGLAAILFLAACTSSSSNNGVCGDGTVDSGEQCDDGNTVSGDGCSATCTIEAPPAVCGDGTVAGTEQCDDGNTTSGDGCSATCQTEYKTTANWAVKLADGTPQTCPNGYDTAALYSQLVDANGQPVGQPVIDLFTCSDGTGTSGYLAPGVYDTWIEITTQSGAPVYAQTVDALVDLTSGDKTYTADIYKDGGYFGWSWNLVGDTSNSALTCSQVSGIAGVELDVLISGQTQVYSKDLFSCEDGRGVTSVLPEGSYSVEPYAFSNSAKLSVDQKLDNEVIMNSNKVTNLGMITLRIIGL